jgi:hypothetical protein
MKIVQASVGPLLAGEYNAKVVILDEGVQYVGEAACGQPDAAVKTAFSVAAKQITLRLSQSLTVRNEVSFG